MSLRIYEQPDPDSSFSVSGTFDNPLAIACDATDGFVWTQRLYVRNDDSFFRYSGIMVQPIDNGAGLVDDTQGFSWKVMAGDTQPTEAAWASQLPGVAVTLTSGTDYLTGTVTYLPFWIRVAVPMGADVDSYTDVKLQLSAYEDLA